MKLLGILTLLLVIASGVRTEAQTIGYVRFTLVNGEPKHNYPMAVSANGLNIGLISHAGPSQTNWLPIYPGNLSSDSNRTPLVVKPLPGWDPECTFIFYIDYSPDRKTVIPIGVVNAPTEGIVAYLPLGKKC